MLTGTISCCVVHVKNDNFWQCPDQMPLTFSGVHVYGQETSCDRELGLRFLLVLHPQRVNVGACSCLLLWLVREASVLRSIWLSSTTASLTLLTSGLMKRSPKSLSVLVCNVHCLNSYILLLLGFLAVLLLYFLFTISFALPLYPPTSLLPAPTHSVIDC